MEGFALKKRLIYIASPYTIGNVEENVQKQIEIFSALIEAGHHAIAPLLCHFIEKKFPKPYKVWADLAMEWLRRSDAVLRLKGKSTGADAEVAEAKRLGIPVYYNIDDLNRYNR